MLKTLERDDVKAAVVIVELRMMVEKSPCACNYFLLLGVSDAASRTAKCLVPPHADFDKKQPVLMRHDEVNFSAPATVVGADKLAAMLFEVTARRQFRLSAGLLPVGEARG